MAVRIAVGLIETREVAELRRRPGAVTYVAYLDGLGQRTERFPGQRLIFGGLYGRSNAPVETIMIDSADESDLKFIARHFPNLDYLELSHAELIADGMAALHDCRRLKSLALHHTDLDESTARQINGLTSLEGLVLEHGLIPSDIHTLLPQLSRLSTSIREYGRPLPESDSDEARSPELYLTIRWSDGERSANLNCWNYLVVEVPNPTNGIRIRPLAASDQLTALRFHIKSNLKDCGDGDYRFYFHVSNHDAEPVTINIVDGLASTRRLEFQAPVTKAEVMKSPALESRL